jgi:uncharacterized membrane protein YfcA
VTLSPAHTALLFVVALLAGAVNSIAGGGSLLTFAALILSGVPPLLANTTSTVALLPGSVSSLWGYRRELRGQALLLLIVGLPSLLGGILGALALLTVGEPRFASLVPWLILGATALFVAQEPLTRRVGRLLPPSPEGAGAAPVRARRPLVLAAVALFQLLVAIYGGFFGSGMGILMLATFGLAGVASLHQRNALKHAAALCINGPAALIFLRQGYVQPGPALLMMLAAVGGGYGGARLALRVGVPAVRRAIIVINLTLAAAAIWRVLG